MLEIYKELKTIYVDYENSKNFHDYICYMMACYLKDGYAYVKIFSKASNKLLLEVNHIADLSDGLLSHTYIGPGEKPKNYIGDTWQRYVTKHKYDNIFAVLKGKEIPAIVNSWLNKKH